MPADPEPPPPRNGVSEEVAQKIVNQVSVFFFIYLFVGKFWFEFCVIVVFATDEFTFELCFFFFLVVWMFLIGLRYCSSMWDPDIVLCGIYQLMRYKKFFVVCM